MDAKVFEFGDVRVDLGLMAVTRGKTPIPLEPKAFDVLVYLLEHRDRLILKEEILDAIWAGTFVTPNVLSRAVAQVRKALGDDGQEARYIDTVAKRGYRFVAPVVVTGGAASAPDAGAAATAPAAIASPPAAPPWRARPVPRAAIAIALLLVIGAAAAILWQRRASDAAADAPSDLHLRRVTNRRGFSATPALSPDGRALVYSSDSSGMLELYLASLTPGVAEVQLTKDGGHNMQPAWSPDGQWIAFHSRKRGGVWIIPATGGAAQQVSEFGSDPAWSPDSATIAFTSDVGGFSGQSTIWTVKRDGTQQSPLTRVGAPPGGHRSPVWSHDGRLVAYVVTHGGWTMELYTVTVATGEQHLVDTTYNGADPCFTRDDRTLIWGGSTPRGNARVFSRALDADGAPSGTTGVLFPMEDGVVEGLSLADNGTLAFAVRTLDENLWAVDAPPGAPPGAPARLTDDVARNTHPSYSRTGRIAYQQIAIGALPSLWTMREDGSDKTPLIPGTNGVSPQWDDRGGRMLINRDLVPDGMELSWIDLASRRITPAGIPVAGTYSMRLSPDARAVAYHTIEQNGQMHVWTAQFGGPRVRVATDREAVSYPVWSPDGAWLAVELKRGDATQVGVVRASGGDVVALTDGPGQSWPYSWTPDQDRIAFAGQRDGVWNVYTVSRQTRDVKQLTFFTSAAGYVRYPAASPVGHRIVFERAMDGATVWTATLPLDR
jgi:Tol biopolymer transport system component/DNA-binding winged helix-turn-helix (wHTH) protein